MRLKLHQEIRVWIILFMVAMALSGITAFPLATELAWMNAHLDLFPDFTVDWIYRVNQGVQFTSDKFPFLFYGTDWLAFAHIIIALAFIGVLRDPVKNKWVVHWGIMSCMLVLPLAFIAGPIRGIPLFHILIDCSFGLFGLVPLWITKNKIRQMEKEG